MIDHFEAENFGCLKKVSCDLTPIHAFLGPNDSGKSTMLRALCEVSNLLSAHNKQSANLPQDSKFIVGAKGDSLLLSSHQACEFVTAIGARYSWSTPLPQFKGRWAQEIKGPHKQPWTAFAERFRGGAWLARFDADSLRAASTLMPLEDQGSFFASRGQGLPGIYDFLQSRGDGSFAEIQREFYDLFPTVKRLGLVPISFSEKKLQIELKDGTEVDSSGFSEGMLFYLAYAALGHLKKPSLIAVEEPETGLHPARVAEIMRLLRSVSEQGTQVLIATHSPLVVNELKANEISVVTRSPEQGTKITPIASTPNFAERSKVYALGELWLSYADGIAEGPLLEGTDAKPASKS